MSADTRQTIRSRLVERVEHAPRAPGVYIMRDSHGEPLYVGKAKDLRSRVRSYFGATTDGRFQIEALLERVADIEFLVTTSEKDALLLENNLIKQIGPRFNIRLRDDKSYVILKLNIRHRWPRAMVTRGFVNDGSLYFGPYSSADHLRSTMRVLAHIFPLRLCSDHTLENRIRPCVYHDIGMCTAPCVGLIAEDEYRRLVDGLIQFLKGRDRQLLDDLRARMQEASRMRHYEQAAALRDQIQAIERTVERQHTEETGATYDRDVFGYSWDGEQLGIQVLFYRDGKLVNSGVHRFRALLPVSELLSSYLVQFYDGEAFIPAEILVPVELEDRPALAAWLGEKAGRRVQIDLPRRGMKRQQLELAAVNAEQALAEARRERQHHTELLESLRERLELSHMPEVVECYDISHLGGEDTVGSRVTFVGGVADKDRYRRYRVRGAGRGDDYAALAEVLGRRFRRGLEEGDLPDLVIIDGGKGQLDRVLAVMSELNVVDIDVIGLAKARRRPPRAAPARAAATDERIFRPGEQAPVVLKQDSPENHFLMRVRDEAHRFAITYHRQRRRRQALATGLDAVPGIGRRRRQLLMRRFGSPRGVARATLDELRAVPGIGPVAAERIHAHFHGGEGNERQGNREPGENE